MNRNDYGRYDMLRLIHPVSSPSDSKRIGKHKKYLNGLHTTKPKVLEICSNASVRKKGERQKGAGFRGGSWNNNSNNARVSDRNNAANTNTNRNNNNGFRCVRSAP